MVVFFFTDIRKTNLRQYQIEGLNWLIKLHEHGVNGILADEMVRKTCSRQKTTHYFQYRVSVKHFKVFLSWVT